MEQITFSTSHIDINSAKKNAVPRILVVEDQPDNLFILKEILERGNFQVITATTGEEALQILHKHPEEIDLVLSDIMMPGISGIMLCETIKTDTNVSHIPVMLITSLCLDEKDEIKGREAGAEDYLTRPINPDLLLKRIKRILETKNVIDFWKGAYEEKDQALTSQEWSTRMLIHDLKNPLTGASGYLTLLAMDPDLTPKQRNLIQKIQVALQQQTEMLQDMLSLAAAKFGRLSLEKETLSLCDVVRENVFMQQGAALQKGMALHTEISGNACLVKADRRLIKRVIANLIINSIKYGEPDTPVEIYVGNKDDNPFLRHLPENDHVWFSIANEAPVIPEADQLRIFRPFEQRPEAGAKNVSPPQEQKYGLRGAGLGLCFCHEIVRLHGGEIGVISPIPGRNSGVVFYFSLPRA